MSHKPSSVTDPLYNDPQYLFYYGIGGRRLANFISGLTWILTVLLACAIVSAGLIMIVRIIIR